MKTLIIAMSLLLVTSAYAKEEYPNYVINLDWSQKSTLEDNIVQMCDDSYFPEVEIVIPGKPGKDFSVKALEASITNGKPEIGCSIKIKTTPASTIYIFDAVGGGCSIEVRKNQQNDKDENQVARYDISDAC